MITGPDILFAVFVAVCLTLLFGAWLMWFTNPTRLKRNHLVKMIKKLNREIKWLTENGDPDVCCCGGDMNHSPWEAGHSAVSLLAYTMEPYERALAKARAELAKLPAPFSPKAVINDLIKTVAMLRHTIVIGVRMNIGKVRPAHDAPEWFLAEIEAMSKAPVKWAEGTNNLIQIVRAERQLRALRG